MSKETDPRKLLENIELEMARLSARMDHLRKQKRKLLGIIAAIEDVTMESPEPITVPHVENPKRLEFAIMNLLSDHPAGLSTDEILYQLKRLGRPDQKRSTLSTTISRLSGAHIFKDKKTKKWRKA